MGTIGTRPLVRHGFTGRLNVFCEPTGNGYLTRATAAATARIRVAGEDAIDDRPGDGHNATVLLGFLAQHFAATLDGHHVCIAGLHTGRLHNRVYGTGDLLLNLRYATTQRGHHAVAALERGLHEGIAAFTRCFDGTALFGRTAADAARIATLEWLKRDLPTLEHADPWAECLLAAAGIVPSDSPPFSCDAIWTAGLPDASTVVLGPGDLAANHAHADGEYVDLADLDDFAGAVARLAVSFAQDRASFGAEKELTA